MALPQAQLGQLPYMQLGSGPRTQTIEPAWHKALAAFLINTASASGKGLADNAMSQDYSEQAAAAGVPGASAEKQAFLDKLLRGPRMDKEGLRAGMRDVTEGKRNELQDSRHRDEIAFREKQLAETIAARGEDRTSREKTAAETAADRKVTAADRALKNSNDAQDRWEKILDSRQARMDRQPLTAAQLKESEARTRVLDASGNPDDIVNKAYLQRSGYTKAELEALDKLIKQFGGGKGAFPAVPGGKPVVNPGGESSFLQSFLAGPTNNATSTSGSNPDANPSAGTSTPMGQSTPPEPDNIPDLENEPVTQAQPLEQDGSESMTPSDLMALVRPASNPNSPTNIGASTTGANSPPPPMSPETYRLAAEFARRMGLAPGMGGTPLQAG